MKSLLMLAMVGTFSLVSVLDAEACHRRRCGGHHRRGCGNTCYAQPAYYGGCQVSGYHNGAYQNGVQVDPNVGAGAALEGGAAVDANAPPADPQPVK